MIAQVKVVCGRTFNPVMVYITTSYDRILEFTLTL